MRCLICGQIAKDILVYIGTKRRKILFWEIKTDNVKHLCRKHLIEEFKKEFHNFFGKLIVFYPDMEEKNKPSDYAYAYASIEWMRKNHNKPGFKEQIIFMEKTLQSIRTSCSKCQNIAQIAYFGKGILKWKTFGLVKWDTPLIEEVTVEPESLCLSCCLQSIEQSLTYFSGIFSGLVVPYGDSGMFFPRSY